MRHRRTLLLLLTVCAWIPTVAVGQSDCGVPFLPSLPVGLQAARTLSAPVAPAPPSFVGDQRTFFTHIPDGRSLATLRLVSEHAAFWVDNRYLSVASDAKLRDLAREFDTVIYPQNRAWFGSEWLPGIDGDYRVVILLHDVEANESAAGFGGYVSQVDTRPDAPISNVREMLYLDVFAVRDYEWFRFINLVAHEFNHLLNWYQRGGRVDERWLEEGRGTFAEWAIYGNLHQSFNEGYLSNPSRSLIAENSLETWYGGSFLLLLYLHDQYGGRAFAEALSRSPYRGIEAIDDALTKAGNAIRFEDALAQWSLANLLNNRALTARGGYQNLAATNKVPASQVIRRQAYPVSTQTQVGQWGARYVELSNFPGASLSVSVNGEHADSFRVNVWRPSRRTYQTMRVTNGVAQQSLNDLAAGESITLVLNSSVDQTLSVSATATNGNNGSLLPAARDAIDPTTTPMRVNDLLPTARRGNAAWQPLGDLPFGATTGGIALSNNDLWVTTGWGLLRFDRTNSAELRFVKAFPTEGVSSGILADTDLVIVAQGDGGVMLLNPRNNAVMSSFRTGGNATKLARRGDWLFILNGDSGLRLYNIADPENPQFVTSVFAGGGLDLLADGDRLYVTDRANGFRIFDISNLPNFPALGQANAPIQALFVHRGLVWGGAGRLVSLNLNNLNDIVVGVDFSTASSPMAIQRRENVLIVAEREAGIGLIDVSVPASPKTLAHLPTRGEAYALATEGDWVYIADGYGGIAVANVALPTSPVFTSRVSMGGFGRGVDVAGGFAFVSTENGGVVIAEALNLARVRTVGVIPTRGGARAVAVGGSVAYVASSVGVESADISDPTAPTLAVSFPTADPAADLV
ncbi:MAG: hypothetical protein O3A46_09875, partial [Candidatus Poribacteria bacterium]|nr:hypothetical protein [Candidatus Poribacteria bacterium]